MIEMGQLDTSAQCYRYRLVSYTGSHYRYFFIF